MLRSGPPSATVTDVAVREVAPLGEDDGFRILH